MNWTDNEKNMILEWARSQYTDDIARGILTEIDKGMDSYWIKAENELTISEYHFENAIELKNMLNESIGDYCQDIITQLVAATIKCRNASELEETEVNKKDKLAVPEYIYTI